MCIVCKWGCIITAACDVYNVHYVETTRTFCVESNDCYFVTTNTGRQLTVPQKSMCSHVLSDYYIWNVCQGFPFQTMMWKRDTFGFKVSIGILAGRSKTRKPFPEHATCASPAGGRVRMAARTGTCNPRARSFSGPTRPAAAFTSKIGRTYTWVCRSEPAGLF